MRVNDPPHHCRSSIHMKDDTIRSIARDKFPWEWEEKYFQISTARKSRSKCGDRTWTLPGENIGLHSTPHIPTPLLMRGTADLWHRSIYPEIEMGAQVAPCGLAHGAVHISLHCVSLTSRCWIVFCPYCHIIMSWVNIIIAGTSLLWMSVGKILFSVASRWNLADAVICHRMVLSFRQ